MASHAAFVARTLAGSDHCVMLVRIIARTRGLDGVTEVEPMLELEVHKFTYAGAGAQL